MLNSIVQAKFIVTADFEFLRRGEPRATISEGMLFALSHLSVGALLPSVQRTPTPAQGAASQGFVQQVQSSIAIAALAGVLSGAVVPPAFAKASIHGTSTTCVLL
jgi:tRNA-binding EMAP/Myf-like protein